MAPSSMSSFLGRRSREAAKAAGLTVLFDGGCPLCRRSVRVLQAIDSFHKLRFADATDAQSRERIAPGLTEAAVLVEMYVVDGRGRRYAGYDGYLQLARVVPLMWPFRLVGGLPGIRQLGHAIYRRIAAKRLRRGRCTDELCAPLSTPGTHS
jgi:predicted DCC family thiol-disulfide oxidoreductase YuxK